MKKWKRKKSILLLLAVLLSLTAACGKEPEQEKLTTAEESSSVAQAEEKAEEVLADNPMLAMNTAPLQVIDDKYRTFYEIFVYSFYDSNGDGIGDLKGMTEKLSYINDGDDATDTDLGCNGIWLMPIMPSTTYHKYDVVDYYDIDPEYGTLEDFDAFMAECEKRDIHVILDLVMNHTSSKHEWFTRACEYLRSLGDREPVTEDCPYFDYYYFTKETGKNGYYQVTGTDWYYEGSFWSEMPDLNLKNEAVREEFAAIVEFWLNRGVSGFRLDAAKEYVSDNTPENVEILSWLNETVKGYQKDAYLVAEVWTSLDAFAAYYQSGIDSVFNFAFADNSGTIVTALRGDAAAYGKRIAKLHETFSAYNPDYIDAPFYINHDLARGAGFFAGESGLSQIKMAEALNLMMSGNAFLYYGEELAMKGSGKDENKRAPFVWSMDAEAEGMCSGPADMDAVEMIYGSLEDQEKDTNSVYWFVKQAVKLRNQFPEIARGQAEYLDVLSDKKVCALKKSWEGSEILLVFNLSAESTEIAAGEVTVGGKPAGEAEIKGTLLTGEEVPVLEESGKLILPAYSMVLIQ